MVIIVTVVTEVTVVVAVVTVITVKTQFCDEEEFFLTKLNTKKLWKDKFCDEKKIMRKNIYK